MKPAAVALLALLVSSLTIHAEPISYEPPGTAAPIAVCRFDSGWVRPSPNEMAATIWMDNRYRDPGEPDGVSSFSRKFYAAHFLLFSFVSSGPAHLLDMSGLANTVPPGDLGEYVCSREFDPGLRTGAAITIWSFGYEVTDAWTDQSTLVVQVEPQPSLEQGFGVVQIPRPLGSDWQLELQMADGTRVGWANDPMHVLAADEPAGLPGA